MKLNEVTSILDSDIYDIFVQDSVGQVITCIEVTPDNPKREILKRFEDHEVVRITDTKDYCLTLYIQKQWF